MSGITWEILDERFSYDPDTGILSVKEVRNSSASYGEEAGWNNGGYRRVSINGKHLLVHKVIWALYYKEKPPEYIDHEDGNGLNNRILNLRAATEARICRTEVHPHTIHLATKVCIGTKALADER